MVFFGWILFLMLYFGAATASAALLYKMSHGDAASSVDEGSLWQRALFAGGVAVGIVVVLLLLGMAAVGIVGPEGVDVVAWILLGVEICVWSIFCLWLCDLENLFQGALYAVVWMAVIRILGLLILWPFGGSIRVFGGLGT